MKRNRRGWLYLLFAVLIMCITLGYAYLNTELQINGTTNITSANWNIYWDNIQYGTNNVTDVTTPATIKTGNTEVEYYITLSTPGDFYEFTVDAVNEGSIDAMIESFSNKTYESNGTTEKALPTYLNYTVTYSDGIALATKQKLDANTTEKIKVRVEFKRDIEANQLPTESDTIVFKFNVTYAQADDTAETRPVPSFSNDSWETIINNIKNNTIPSYYKVGSTKEVDMGTFGTHTLRIANTTTPAECSTEGFSGTACGFVLEFADSITTHRMNPFTSRDANLDGSTVNGTGNKGGWEYSDMRAFLNSTTYANESIDYSTTGIYSSLPEILRNAIINTTVVSGHGGVDTTNYTTTDKLYLLSPMEVWGNNSSSQYDSARNLSRQMDYYSNLGVNNSSYSGAIKQRNGSNSWWWLRSAVSYTTTSFINVSNIGSDHNIIANNTSNVSPAFRIA